MPRFVARAATAEVMAETQPQLHPALLRLSAMISEYFTRRGLIEFAILQCFHANCRI